MVWRPARGGAASRGAGRRRRHGGDGDGGRRRFDGAAPAHGLERRDQDRGDARAETEARPPRP